MRKKPTCVYLVCCPSLSFRFVFFCVRKSKYIAALSVAKEAKARAALVPTVITQNVIFAHRNE